MSLNATCSFIHPFINSPFVLSIIISHSTLYILNKSSIHSLNTQAHDTTRTACCVPAQGLSSLTYHMLILAVKLAHLNTSTYRQVIPRRRLSLLRAKIACSNLATLGDVSRMRPSSTVHFPSVYLMQKR